MATQPKALTSKHAGAHPGLASPPPPAPGLPLCPPGSSISRCHLAPSTTTASRQKEAPYDKEVKGGFKVVQKIPARPLMCWREETELKASNLPDGDPPVTAACQRMPELPKHVRQPRPRSHTPGNHTGTAQAAMATSHSVAIMEPWLPSKGSAFISITALI